MIYEHSSPYKMYLNSAGLYQTFNALYDSITAASLNACMLSLEARESASS